MYGNSTDSGRLLQNSLVLHRTAMDSSGLLWMLELCAQNRNLEGVTEDLEDWVISILGGQSFAFSFADALDLHWT